MTETFREIYWNVGETLGSLTVYLSAIVALAVMTWGVLRDFARWRKGRPAARIENLPARASEFLTQVFGQKKVLKDRKPGVMHALVFFGFLALFIGTDIIAIEEDFTIPLMGPDAGRILVGEFYKTYELVLDFMGLVFLAGLIWMAVRRYVVRPDRLNTRRTDTWVLATLLYITVSGFLIEGLRLANQTIGGLPVYEQEWATRAFAGYTLAALFRGVGLGNGSAAGLGLHLFFWFSHTFVTFAFIASIPFSKYKHIFYTPLNTFFRDAEPKGALQPIPALEAEIEKDEPRLGVATLGDFTWKQRLDFDACMRCGRCQSKCPASAAGTELSPKFLITKMADLMRGEPILLRDGTVARVHPNMAETTAESGEAGKPADERERWTVIRGEAESLPLYEHGLFTENEIWSCTTCRHDRARRPDRGRPQEPDDDPVRGSERRQAGAGGYRAPG
jgi:nitrate reductase gamma subunit/ferredoxin